MARWGQCPPRALGPRHRPWPRSQAPALPTCLSATCQHVHLQGQEPGAGAPPPPPSLSGKRWATLARAAGHRGLGCARLAGQPGVAPRALGPTACPGVATEAILPLGLCGLSDRTPLQPSFREASANPARGEAGQGSRGNRSFLPLPSFPAAPAPLGLARCRCRDPSHFCFVTAGVTSFGGVRVGLVPRLWVSGCDCDIHPPPIAPPSCSHPLRCPLWPTSHVPAREPPSPRPGVTCGHRDQASACPSPLSQAAPCLPSHDDEIKAQMGSQAGGGSTHT